MKFSSLNNLCMQNNSIDKINSGASSDNEEPEEGFSHFINVQTQLCIAMVVKKHCYKTEKNRKLQET